MDVDDDDGLAANRICSECVDEPFLCATIGMEGRALACDYCGETGQTISLGQLAEHIEGAFERHYVRTPLDPEPWVAVRDSESDSWWTREGIPVVEAIQAAAEIPEDAAAGVQQLLEAKHADVDLERAGEETEFSSEAHYDFKGVDQERWREAWQSFERGLKAEARFFSRTAMEHLATIFDRLDELRTRGGQKLIVDAGPETAHATVFRARVFQSDEELTQALERPDLQLGSPPPKLARAGRMNARGISVFYGAATDEVAIAEVRPPVGSRVAVAEFDIIRPLRLLDLTRLGEVSSRGSIFDPDHASDVELAVFLKSLAARITRPVMPNDEEFDYLATQAVADFLATEAEPRLDGILFPSVQAQGEAMNLVLFHKSARVETLDLPAGSRITAELGHWEDDAFEIDYRVDEQTPAPKPAPRRRTSADGVVDFASLIVSWPDPDWREPALRARTENIQVHHVQRVQFRTEAHQVRRNRTQL